MRRFKAKIAEDGTILIPDDYLQAMGLKAGDEVVLLLDGAEIRLFSIKHSISRAQELVKKYLPQDHSLADDLVAERRKDAD